MASSSSSLLLKSLFSLSLSTSPPPPSHITLSKTPPIPLSSSSLPSLTAAGRSHSNKHKQPITPIIPKEAQYSLPSDLIALLCPAFANSNTLFFKSAYNLQVIVGEHEPEEKLIGRFRRDVLRAGIIQECKRRRFFETNQEKRKRKTREAAKRNRKRRPILKAQLQDQQEVAKKIKDEEDNWDLVDVNIPYC